jgi:hypothetical protein
LSCVYCLAPTQVSATRAFAIASGGPSSVVPPAARQRRRPTEQGVALSEELIVETDLRLIEEHGTDALSVRSLGRALGADPSSLYRYSRRTDDLMLAIADELIGRTLRTWRPSGDWLADLRAPACACRPVRSRIPGRLCSAPPE